jgi:hypothetical protein
MLFAVIRLGFLGMRHAIDPDNVLAVTTIRAAYCAGREVPATFNRPVGCHLLPSVVAWESHVCAIRRDLQPAAGSA